MDDERNVVQIDTHRAWIEEPLALVIEMHGDLLGEQLKRMRELIDYVGDGEGPVIILQDLSKGGAFTQSARKEILRDNRTERVKSVICIGANFQMRVFMGMIINALKTFRPSLPWVLFAQDSQEGRAILVAERKRLLAAG